MWKYSSSPMALLDHVADDDKRNDESLSSLQQGQRLRPFRQGRSSMGKIQKDKMPLDKLANFAYNKIS